MNINRAGVGRVARASLMGVLLSATSFSLIARAQAEEVVTFWHSMGAAHAPTLEALVAEFNAEHAGEIRVEAIFQGSYGDSLAKLTAAIQASTTPTIVQVYEIGTTLMMDLDVAVPLQDVAADAGIDLSEILPAMASYFSVDGKLQSLPFNASAPMFYYNKDAFRAAGLDPEQPPTTLGEVRAMAESLLIKNGEQVSQYGYVSSVDGWFVEQWFARADQTYCNAGNGREGRADGVTWDNPVLHDILSFWRDIMDDGVGMNAGRVSGDAIAAFVSGRAASLILTSAPMRDIIERSEFEVGVANFPAPIENAQGSVFNGGASIWLLKDHDEAEQAAALEFMKFLASAEAQGTWSAGTGYIPTNIHAADTEAYKEIVATYPDFDKPRQQLATAAQSVASSGCLVGVLPQARPRLNEVIDSVLLGGDIQQAITEGQNAVDGLIANYNRSIGQ